MASWSGEFSDTKNFAGRVRPREILRVPKIRPGELDRRQTYRDIAISKRKSPSALLPSFTQPGGRKLYRASLSKPDNAAIVLFYWLTRAWH